MYTLKNNHSRSVEVSFPIKQNALKLDNTSENCIPYNTRGEKIILTMLKKKSYRLFHFHISSPRLQRISFVFIEK